MVKPGKEENVGWVFLAQAQPSPAAAFCPLYCSRQSPVKREAKTSCTIASAAQRCQTVHPETCACPCALSCIFRAYHRAPKHMPGLEMEVRTSIPIALLTPVCAPTRPLVCLPAAQRQLYDIYVRSGKISSASAVHAPCLAEQQNICSSQRRSDCAPRTVALRMLARHLAPAKVALSLHGPGSGLVSWLRLSNSLGCSL